MSERTTIDFGIDLGTTNSCVAMLKGTDTEIFKDNDNADVTPSAVYINKNGKLYVGRAAKDKFKDEPENVAFEFKLQMGTEQERIFKDIKRNMRPEELSAEVLKELKQSVRRRLPEDISAAVITVPAAFELPQCEATKKAALLAGLTNAPLLQEPVAAALAYGFMSECDRAFWFVYDFGGGTFDAAVMQVRDGVIQVVNHIGDNHLGGKLLDWVIVDQLFVPALAREYKLQDFHRGNPKWNLTMAKLKYFAEEAKIRVSNNESWPLTIDSLGVDDRGNTIKLDYDLQRSDVVRLAAPFIFKSINICKKVLSEKGLCSGDVEKVLLVGGPTIAPYFREQLEDKNAGLGIKLEYNIDPLTVVARGAAVFSGTQRINPDRSRTVKVEGVCDIQLEYKPVGADTEPLVCGRVLYDGEKRGFTIEFVNMGSHLQWRSGRIGLNADGAFATNLRAEKGQQNTYSIELYDAKGSKLPTNPEKLTYTVGMVITDPLLTHAVGIGMITNEIDWYFEKGAPLPVRGRRVYKTTHEVRQGEHGELVRIIAYEGGGKRADRNSKIGVIEVPAIDVKRNLPIGSEVEVTIEIDQSRLLKFKAYIPILDEEFETKAKLILENPDNAELGVSIENEKKRLSELQSKVKEVNSSKAANVLEQISQEQLMCEIEASLAAAATDRDAADKCNKNLRELRIALDDVEVAIEWPSLVGEADALIPRIRQDVKQYGKQEDVERCDCKEDELKRAIIDENIDIVRQRLGELRDIWLEVLNDSGILPVLNFQWYSENKSSLRDKTQVDELVAQGERALHNNDVDTLRAINSQLATFRPVEMPAPDVSTLMK